MDMYEIAVEWTTPASTNGRSIFYFDASGGAIAAARSSLGNFLAAYIPYCANTVEYDVPIVGRILNDATGQHIGDWAESTVLTGAGTQTDGPVPDVAQVLVRWQTDLFRNGRRLQGRNFLPGLARANVEGGNAAPGVVTAVSGAAMALAAASSGLVIWSRPQPSRVGQAADVARGSCWTEMATQRRRRA